MQEELTKIYESNKYGTYSKEHLINPIYALQRQLNELYQECDRCRIKYKSKQDL